MNTFRNYRSASLAQQDNREQVVVAVFWTADFRPDIPRSLETVSRSRRVLEALLDH